MATDLAAVANKRSDLEAQNKQAEINNNLSLRQAALQASVELRKNSPVRDTDDLAEFLKVTVGIEDYIRGTDIPRAQ